MYVYIYKYITQYHLIQNIETYRLKVSIRNLVCLNSTIEQFLSKNQYMHRAYGCRKALAIASNDC